MERLELDESLTRNRSVHQRVKRQHERHDSFLLLIQRHLIEKDVTLANVRLHVSLHHSLLVHVCDAPIEGPCGNLCLSAEMVAHRNQRVVSLDVRKHRLLKGLRTTECVSAVALTGPVLIDDALAQRGIAREEGENHETGCA